MAWEAEKSVECSDLLPWPKKGVREARRKELGHVYIERDGDCAWAPLLSGLVSPGRISIMHAGRLVGLTVCDRDLASDSCEGSGKRGEGITGGP